MVMAQMGGRELVDRLREQGRDMKVLYISGYTDDASVYAAELPAGSAFLQKPFTLSALLEKVQQILGRV
jgi:CheY-like chemotaxis protein